MREWMGWMVQREHKLEAGGFTMIELLVAMALFSFMLAIIVTGFLNVVRIHNQAIASDLAQDNARTAMDELVRAVRNSTGTVGLVPATAAHTLCLSSSTGPQTYYYIDPVTKALMRATDCTAHLAPQAITSSAVQVFDFSATQETSGTDIVKPQVELSVTVASSNGTTQVVSGNISCGPSDSDREYCATVTLTSGAVPR